jgi:hypothetical protein
VKRKDSAAMVGKEKGEEALTQKRTIRRLVIKLEMLCLLITMQKAMKSNNQKKSVFVNEKAMR